MSLIAGRPVEGWEKFYAKFKKDEATTLEILEGRNEDTAQFKKKFEIINVLSPRYYEMHANMIKINVSIQEVGMDGYERENLSFHRFEDLYELIFDKNDDWVNQNEELEENLFGSDDTDAEEGSIRSCIERMNTFYEQFKDYNDQRLILVDYNPKIYVRLVSSSLEMSLKTSHRILIEDGEIEILPKNREIENENSDDEIDDEDDDDEKIYLPRDFKIEVKKKYVEENGKIMWKSGENWTELIKLGDYRNYKRKEAYDAVQDFYEKQSKLRVAIEMEEIFRNSGNGIPDEIRGEILTMAGRVPYNNTRVKRKRKNTTLSDTESIWRKKVPKSEVCLRCTKPIL